MKIVTASLAVVMLSGLAGSLPAQAQGMPQGSYLRSCSDVSAGGDTLVATCRRIDGRSDRTALAGFRRCVGDIGNDNGTLQCSARGGGQLRGELAGGSGYRPGPSGSGGPGPYGPPPAGWQRDRWDHCGGLHREADELRGRLDREYNPAERARLQDRLRDIRGQEDRCR
ncbi:MAG TPA: hypothetical protein VHY35_01030 [Stellaceae bacterium]|nr:hypothetical protein [Stellaceae bacterium]